MNAAELDNFLFRYTESEIKHKKAGEPRLSERYQLIPKTSFMIGGLSVFFSKSFRKQTHMCPQRIPLYLYSRTHSYRHRICICILRFLRTDNQWRTD